MICIGHERGGAVWEPSYFAYRGKNFLDLIRYSIRAGN